MKKSMGMALLLCAALGGCDEDPGGAPPVGDGGVPAPRPLDVGVVVRLQQLFDGASTASFGVPIPKGMVKDPLQVSVKIGGRDVGAEVRELLAEQDAAGARVGVRALGVQLPASALTGELTDVEVLWKGGGVKLATAPTPYASLSAESPEVVETTERTIESSGGVNKLVEGPITKRTLFTGREPRLLPIFPEGYLAQSGILGPQLTPAEVQPGLRFMSDALRDFGLAAIYAEAYPLHPDSITDPLVEYEGWLYDRCTTFLTAYAHTGEGRFWRHALRTCSFYAGKINLAGADVGIFSGKPDPDRKYSHLRGLYVYYALTGDELALQAGTAMAEMWLTDTQFVGPYRQGHTDRIDGLWTERLLGTSMEALLYGHRLTGEVRYLDALREMVDTAYRHITGDAAQLMSINPGAPFPPQNCFIHSAEQHSEGSADEPWCSIWMSELTVDALIAYQAQTGDDRPDEIFVRLGRFLRDVGTSYFKADLNMDSFFDPVDCYDPSDGIDRRILVPLYGSGIDGNGTRRTFGEYADFEHCTDATALSAAALRGLKRSGGFDQNPIAPFASEGESFVQLHHEFAECAKAAFEMNTRPRRAPSIWTSAGLEDGLADPKAFIDANKIGYPTHAIAPQRKIGWWFNVSMLQFALLKDAGIAIDELKAGRIQPAGCP